MGKHDRVISEDSLLMAAIHTADVGHPTRLRGKTQVFSVESSLHHAGWGFLPV